MTKPSRPHPERWVFMLKGDATEETTKAFADKIDAEGKARGFKTVDHFAGALLVESNEAFAREMEKKFASELRNVVKEGWAKLPDTRPKIRKPPAP